MTRAPNTDAAQANGPATSPKSTAPKDDVSIASISLTNAITLLTVILNLVIGGLVGVYHIYVIPAVRSNLETQLDVVKKRADDAERQSSIKADELRNQIARLEDIRTKASEQTGRPLLLYPKNDEIVISNEITFRWDYKTDGIAQYIIEISKASKDGIKTFTYSVLQPDKRLFHLPVGTFGTGQYLWRVRPGVVQEDKEVSTGPWSAYQSFAVYTSVLEKVLRTGRLTVGMYASFFDRFNSPVAGGKFEGFSVDFARHIARTLTSTGDLVDQPPGRAVATEFVSIAWQDLFEALKSGRVDIIVSSVTATKRRELEHDVLFSLGYFVTDQILLSRMVVYDSRQSLFRNLKNKRIGAVKETTNAKAAEHINNKCKCGSTVNSTFLQLIEAKKALFQGDIDLLLVDDIFRTGESDLGEFNKFGPTLGPHLKEFYEDEYGRTQEEYGVVVLRRNGREMLDEINRIIKLPDTKTLLQELKLKWRV